MNSMKSKDKKARQLVGELQMIKSEVKIAILKKYLFMCSIKHSLAFFQWRSHNNPDSDVSDIYGYTL